MPSPFFNFLLYYKINPTISYNVDKLTLTLQVLALPYDNAKYL